MHILNTHKRCYYFGFAALQVHRGAVISLRYLPDTTLGDLIATRFMVEANDDINRYYA